MIALGADHGGFELKEAIKKHLDEKGVEYKDFGTYTPESIDYAKIAYKACQSVVSGEAEKAILCCGTGIGISMAANKVKGIRCALCHNEHTAQMTRLHNDSNVLAMGAAELTPTLAKRIAEIWLDTEFSGEEKHARRIRLISEIEEG